MIVNSLVINVPFVSTICLLDNGTVPTAYDFLPILFIAKCGSLMGLNL
jgi:hypothetical protein